MKKILAMVLAMMLLICAGAMAEADPYAELDSVELIGDTEKKRLKVMVKIFGRSTPVDLGYMQVDKE